MAGCRAPSGEPAPGRPARVAVAALAVLTLLVASSTVHAAKVVPAEGTLPSERVGAPAVVTEEGIVYVFGGRRGQEFLDEIVRYDPSTGESSVVARLPPVSGGSERGRYSMSAVWTGSKAYVFGGAAMRNVDLNADGETESVPTSIPDIVEFDPSSSSGPSATRLVADALPSGVWGTSAVWWQGKAYVFGGLTFDLTAPPDEMLKRRDWILAFDPAAPAGTKVKRESTVIPYPLQDMAATLVGDRALLMGGLGDHDEQNPCPADEDGAPSNACTTAAIVTVELNRKLAYVSVAKLPQPVQWTAAATVNGSAYVFGGRAADGTALSSIVRVDVAADKTVPVFPSLPGGRLGMPALAIGNEVVLVGGRDAGQFHSGMKDVLRFVAGPTEPWAPRDLEVTTPPDKSGVVLSWAPPAYDGEAAITHYNVYRILSNGSSEFAGRVSDALSFTDAGATAGEEYTFRVTAANRVGESSTGVEAHARAPTRAPSAPLGFQAFAGDGVALLRWLPPSDDGGAEIVAYRIYRGDEAKPYAEVGGSVREHNDTGVTNGETYTYRVSAVNSVGAGPLTETRGVVPNPVPDAPPNLVVEEIPDGLRVSWDASAGSVSGYRLYRGTEPDHLAPVSNDSLAVTEYVDAEAARGRIYYYAVSAVNKNGEGAWSPVVFGGLISPPSEPRNLLVAAGPGRVNLSWIAPADLGGADEVTYLVYRTGPDGARRVIAGDIAAPRHTDREVVPGVEYRYSVAASNGLTGARSVEKAVTPQVGRNALPVAHLAVVGGNRADVGALLEFDASLSADSDGRVVSYEFDWGDGSPATVSDKPQVSRAFARDGCFTVATNVVDDGGARSSKPAYAAVEIGTCGIDGRSVDDVPPTEEPREPAPPPKPPGSGIGRIPAPGAPAAALALIGAVLLASRRR